MKYFGLEAAFVHSNIPLRFGRVSTPDITAGSFDTFTPEMVIDTAGNVGIGTSTPAQKLDVAGNVNASGNVSGGQLVSTVPTGTAPLAVSSTTKVTNLNADLLDGVEAAAFAAAAHGHDVSAITNAARLGANTFTGTQWVETGAAGNTGIVVRAAPGQSAKLQEWRCRRVWIFSNRHSQVSSASTRGRGAPERRAWTPAMVSLWIASETLS